MKSLYISIVLSLLTNVLIIIILFLAYYIPVRPLYPLSHFVSRVIINLLAIHPGEVIYPRGFIINQPPFLASDGRNDHEQLRGKDDIFVEVFFRIEQVTNDIIVLRSYNGLLYNLNIKDLNDFLNYDLRNLSSGDIVSLYWIVNSSDFLSFKKNIQIGTPESLYVHWSSSWTK